jgi:predicted transcriptional regulator
MSPGGRRFCLPHSSRNCTQMCYFTFMSKQPDDTTKEAGSNIFPLSTVAKPRKRKDKWPNAVLSRGYSMIPSILLWGQAKMGLQPDQLNVLLQLISHWWSADHDPHPAKDTIARRMGKDARTVQRHLTALETKGFIKRVERFKRHKGQDSNGYDLSGLIAKLETIAPEFEKVTDQNKRRRAKAETKTA